MRDATDVDHASAGSLAPARRPTLLPGTPRPPGGGLPSPPTDEEKHWYVGHADRPLLWLGVIATLFALVSAARFVVSVPWLVPLWLLVAVSAASLIVGTLSSSRRQRMDRASHETRVRSWHSARHLGGTHEGHYPSIDVFLPTAGEPLEVLDNTYRHVARLRWRGRLVVHVLDDGGRDEVRALAASYGFDYASRPDRGHLKKAGNLRYGYSRTGGELILVLDADFAPRPDMVAELVPYFDDPEIGIVQSPQFFGTDRSMGWLERGAGATQELFYRFVQPARDRVDAAICVGTCALYRRRSLAAAGGFARVQHSEDVHTGVRLAQAGFLTRYVPVLLARGLCPDSLEAFCNQQYRWCSGSMSLMRSLRFWDWEAGWRRKLCFVSGFLYYIATAAIVLLAKIPTPYLLWARPEDIANRNYLPLVPAALMLLTVWPLAMRARWRPEVLRVQMLYSLAHAVALADVFRGRTAAWVPTGGVAGRTAIGARIRRIAFVWLAPLYVVWIAGMARLVIGYGWQPAIGATANLALSLYVALPVFIRLART